MVAAGGGDEKSKAGITNFFSKFSNPFKCEPTAKIISPSFVQGDTSPGEPGLG